MEKIDVIKSFAADIKRLWQMRDGLNVDTEAIKPMLKQWYSNKYNFINSFKKSSNYDHENGYRISMYADIRRELDLDAGYTYYNKILAECITLDNAKYRTVERYSSPEEREEVLSGISGYTIGLFVNPNTPYVTDYMIQRFNSVKNEYLTSGCVSTFMWRLGEVKIPLSENEIAALTKLKIHKGQKSTRFFRELCLVFLKEEKKSDFEKYFAIFADALTPAKMRRKFYLSVNPFDYLCMSEGVSWHSCHNPWEGGDYNEGGCHGAGPWSYMMDKHSMVLFCVPEKDENLGPSNQPKIYRMMLHFDPTSGHLLCSRVYPQANDEDSEIYKEMRDIARRFVADAFSLPNEWSNARKSNSGVDPRHVATADRATHYLDYYHFTVYSLFPKGWYESWEDFDNKNEITLTIGAEGVCVCCGDPVYYGETDCYAYCPDCRGDADRTICDSCGAVVDRDDAYWSDEYGRYYCPDCAFWCDYCDDAHPSWNHIRLWINEPSAWARSGYTEMAACDRTPHQTCDYCGNVWVENVTFTKLNGYWCCPSCVKERKDEIMEKDPSDNE